MMNANDICSLACESATDREIRVMREWANQRVRLYGAGAACSWLVDRLPEIARAEYPADVDRGQVLHAAIDFVMQESSYGHH